MKEIFYMIAAWFQDKWDFVKDNPHLVAAYMLIGAMIAIYGLSLRSRFRRAQKAMPDREDRTDE